MTGTLTADDIECSGKFVKLANQIVNLDHIHQIDENHIYREIVFQFATDRPFSCKTTDPQKVVEKIFKCIKESEKIYMKMT